MTSKSPAFVRSDVIDGLIRPWINDFLKGHADPHEGAREASLEQHSRQLEACLDLVEELHAGRPEALTIQSEVPLQDRLHPYNRAGMNNAEVAMEAKEK